ncbi:MAG: hypothetical protein U0Q07_18900 [Acidimicrobiales bacterium]
MVEEPDDHDAAEAPPIEAVYDDATLRRLGVAPATGAEPTRPAGSPARAGRATASAMALALTAALRGVGEALEPDEGHVVEAEVDPGWEAFADRPVQFVPVWGDPRASVVLVRPWLSRR